MIRVWNSKPEKIFSFVRQNAEHKVLAVINFSDQPQTVSFDGSLHQGEYQEYLTGESHTLEAESEIHLQPWGFKVLVGQ